MNSIINLYVYMNSCNDLVKKMDITKDMMASSEVFDSIMGEWTREESPIQDTYQVKVKGNPNSHACQTKHKRVK